MLLSTGKSPCRKPTVNSMVTVPAESSSATARARIAKAADAPKLENLAPVLVLAMDPARTPTTRICSSHNV